MKRLSTTLIGTIAALAVAAALGPISPASAAGKMLIIFPTPSGASWPIWIAELGGIYKKYGLDIEGRFGRHPAGIAGVSSGDAVMTNYGSDSAIAAASKGKKLKVIGSPLNIGSFVLIGAKGLRSVNDLEGKRLAVGRVGDPPYHYTLALLAKLGVDAGKIHWVPAGAPPLRAAAVKNGQADASLLTPPSYYRLEAAGFPVLANMADHRDIVISQYYLVRKDIDRAIAKKILMAHTEAVKRFYDDKAFAVKAMSRFTKGSPKGRSRVYDQWKRDRMLERIPYITKASLAAVVERSKRRKRNLEGTDFSRIVDNSIVDELVAEGFFEKVFGPSIKGEIEKMRKAAYRG